MKQTYTAIFISVLFFSGCGGNTKSEFDDPKHPNYGANTATPSVGVPTPPSQLAVTPTPPESKPLTESVPGISVDATPQVIKPGGTPIPGIPNSKDIVKPLKPGSSPTPGIPSPEEIRRMLNTPQDANAVNRRPDQSGQAKPESSNRPAAKSKRSLGGKVE